MVVEANGLAESIANSFSLIKPIMNTLLNYDNIDGIKNFLIYILESGICYIIVVFIMDKIYLKGAIGTTINSNRKIEKLKKLEIGDFKVKSKNISYLSKEIKTMVRTPIFLLECLIMPIVYPILVFLIMVVCIKFASNIGVDVLAEFYKRLEQTSGQAVFIAIGQVFYMMNFCSIIAVSRESKNSIITKYIPINLKTQFNLKISIGVVVNSISTILVAICYYYCSNNIIQTLLVLAILILLNLICEKFKLLIDLKNPKISWDNEYTMMKQNTNIMSELFYTLIVIGILLLISVFTKNIQLYLVLVLLVSLCVNFKINRYVNKKEELVFKKIF